MAVRFGDQRRFAAEVGEFSDESRQGRRVDLWAAGRRLTCDDNNVFIPQFCMSVRSTVDWLRSDCDLSLPFPGLSPAETHRQLLAVGYESRSRFLFPYWGPTTDNLLGHLFRVGDRLAFTFEFWRDTHPVSAERGVVFSPNYPKANSSACWSKC